MAQEKIRNKLIKIQSQQVTVRLGKADSVNLLIKVHDLLLNKGEELLRFQIDAFTKKSEKCYYLPTRFEVLNAFKDRGESYLECNVEYHWVRPGFILYDLGHYLKECVKNLVIKDTFISHDTKVVIAEKGISLPLPHAFINNRFYIQPII